MNPREIAEINDLLFEIARNNGGDRVGNGGDRACDGGLPELVTVALDFTF